MIETVTETFFKTEDGARWPTRDKAMEHERFLQFESWFNENDFSIETDDGFYTVAVCDVRKWLSRNKKDILEFLNEAE
jgi:hypothetical protein|tara:strand:+ start:3330 stop:3563 length:234 start_codon:yes stop_codon:yes gene_type:complete